MVEKKRMDKLVIPTCDKCGNKMKEITQSYANYPEENKKDLGNGLVKRYNPTSHTHSFQCRSKECVPPIISIEVPYKG